MALLRAKVPLEGSSKRNGREELPAWEGEGCVPGELPQVWGKGQLWSPTLQELSMADTRDRPPCRQMCVLVTSFLGEMGGGHSESSWAECMITT